MNWILHWDVPIFQCHCCPCDRNGKEISFVGTQGLCFWWTLLPYLEWTEWENVGGTSITLGKLHLKTRSAFSFCNKKRFLLAFSNPFIISITGWAREIMSRGSSTNETKERGGFCYNIWYWGERHEIKSHKNHAYLIKTPKKKTRHIFSVFVRFCKQYPSRVHIKNTWWQVTKIRGIYHEKKKKFYKASRMQHCLAWMFFFFLHYNNNNNKKSNDKTFSKSYLFAFWQVTCSLIVNTGSVKTMTPHVQAILQIFPLHTMKRASLLSYALVIWGIFSQSYRLFLSVSVQSIVCLEGSGRSVDFGHFPRPFSFSASRLPSHR